MSTALFVLRAKQIGLTLDEMDELDFGFVLDMFTESVNDNFDYKQVATQADFERF